MKDFFRRLLGIEKTTKYERNYLNDTNVRTSIYMASVVIVLEVWMIIRFITKYSIPRGYDLATSLANMKYYFVLLATGIIMFTFAIFYTVRKKKNRILGTVLITAFATICVYFGIKTSLSDLLKGYQIICFLTMIMFAACLLIWKPYISIILLVAAFYIFGFLGNIRMSEVMETNEKYAPYFEQSVSDDEIMAIFDEKTGESIVNARAALRDRNGYFFKWMFYPAMQKGDVINLITFWISIVMISVSIYMQRVGEAKKDERLELAYERLRLKSVTDELTEIPNITGFSDEAKKLLKKEEIDPAKKIFLYINIENFSNYNEKYGFEAGNDYLRKCAAIIRGCFSEDPHARLSDDHFIVFTAEETAQNRIDAVKSKVESIENVIKMSVKVGGYIPENRETDPRTALDRARYACNSIKHSKSIYYQIYDKRMDEDFKRKQYIINNLDEAIKNGYVKPYYQPVVWAGDKTLCGAEALARWIDPNLGFLSPGAFVPVLEEYKEIHKLDASIMESVCRDIRSHLDRGEPIVPISINFSRLDFELTDIVGEFEAFVEKYRIPKEYLHVEITESAITEQLGVLRDNIYKVKEHGYPIWLDDFGSGYSSLNSLKEYSFDVVKIDMAFLKNFESNPKAGPIIENVIRLAKSVDMETLTEGVETAEQAEFLAKAGCGRLQGYFFGKPMPMEDLDAAIGSNRYTVSDRLFEK